MANRILNLLTDETRYRGLTRVAFHGLLVVGVILLTYFSLSPPGPILRDSFCVIVQYYMLVYLVKHFARKPLVLIPGLAAYYLVTFTCYYYASYVINPHFLFNVLNSIYVLTEEDNPRAARIVEQLSAMDA
uniref:His_kinase domain-containing protein n=1 Tax=Globodera pallida TaxID=36090 RepID=A0A183CSD7_GLOPA